MKRCPHRSVCVGRKLDKVIAAAKSSERHFPVRIGREVIAPGGFLELIHAYARRVRQAAVVSAGAHGNAPLDAGADGAWIRNVVPSQRRLYRDHSAADVD